MHANSDATRPSLFQQEYGCMDMHANSDAKASAAEAVE
jgi:hypothetical protein